MKKKILLIFIFIIIIILFSRNNIVAKENYDISINFSNTEYEILNKEINKSLETYIDIFKQSMVDIDKTYTLNINHSIYEYKNYISYVFYAESYTGGAHPSHDIWTITYDKYLNKIVDIDTLINKNSNILNIFSKISREKLLYDKRIVDTNMMLEGTKPIKNNFSNFAFSKDGLILFFEYYQVAPYSSGDFKVTIPYSDIDIL